MGRLGFENATLTPPKYIICVVTYSNCNYRMSQKRIDGVCHVKSEGGYHANIEARVTGTDSKCKFTEDSVKRHEVRIHNYRNHSLKGVIHSRATNSCIEFCNNRSQNVEHEHESSPGSDKRFPVSFRISQCNYGPDTVCSIKTKFESTSQKSDFEESPLIEARVTLNSKCISSD